LFMSLCLSLVPIRNLRSLYIALLVALTFPASGFAQYDAPPNFSVTPSAVAVGGCYTIHVPNWAAAQLNVGYTTAWTGQQFIFGWPSLDFFGDAVVCTDSLTRLGTYTYNLAANTYYGEWWSVNASITVNDAVPQQPTSLTFSPSSGYAGNDCYTMTVGNAASMTVDLSYALNGSPQPSRTTTLNAAGQWKSCFSHYDEPGSYVFSQIKNHLLSTWVTLNSPVTQVLRPPQPASLQITPSSILQGSGYRISVANGAGVTLDVQYSLNDGVTQTISGWPLLVSDGSSGGYVDIGTGPATSVGKYVFTAIRNTLNTAWVPLTASVSVCPDAAPTISLVSPNAVQQGSSVNLTITGANLCAPAVQAVTNTGLIFSNITANSALTSINATATASSSAPLGQTSIRVTTPAGNAISQFIVTGSPVLTKEYIYLGNRVISTVSP
jgi:hypothetical protein